MSASDSSTSGRQARKPGAAEQGASLLTRVEGRASALLVGSVIGVLALTPGAASRPTLFGWDKVDHLAAFAVLALLARCGWPSAPRWALFAALFAAGVAIEMGQGSSYVVGRTASLADLAANAIGIGLGLAAAAMLTRLAPRAPWMNRR